MARLSESGGVYFAGTRCLNMRDQLGQSGVCWTDRHVVYFFRGASQLGTMLMGGATSASAMTFRRNRPSRVTTYCGRPAYEPTATVPPVASRVGNNATGVPGRAEWPSVANVIGTAMRWPSEAT